MLGLASLVCSFMLEGFYKKKSMLMKYIVPEKEVRQHGKLSRRYGKNIGWFYKVVPCLILYLIGNCDFELCSI